LQVSDLASEGFDKTRIEKLINRIQDNTYKRIHSVLIVRNNKLVLEEYFPGFTYNWSGYKFQGDRINFGRDIPHNLASVTKSITSTLVGIAIDQGCLKSVDRAVFDYFPTYAHLKTAEKEKITIKHLLTMSSGFEWNEWEYSLSDIRNDLIQFCMVNDPPGYILGKDVCHDPGTTFYYNSAGINLLGEIIKHASGLNAEKFAEQYLFTPIGSNSAEWKMLTPEIVFTSGDLKLTPRDMAKIGFLFLNNGKWNGEQILSPKWIAQACKEQISLRDNPYRNRYGYGYSWWLKTYTCDATTVNSCFASGWGGQKIHLFPDLEMIVVFTGGNYANTEPCDEILTKYILPAVL